MADDFFAKGQESGETTESDVSKEEASSEAEKIKVGEKEYTQEEVTKLVGLGELGAELESKWNTKLDRLYPEYTKVTQRIRELEEEKSTKEASQVQAKAQKGEELSTTEQENLVRQELSKYGVVTEEKVNDYIANFLAGKDLLDKTQKVVSEAETEGKPKVSAEDLLLYMQESGIKDPIVAYKVKFEEDLEKIKEQQLMQMKKPGLITTTESTAGAKVPQQNPVTKENLSSVLAEFMQARRQG